MNDLAVLVLVIAAVVFSFKLGKIAAGLHALRAGITEIDRRLDHVDGRLDDVWARLERNQIGGGVQIEHRLRVPGETFVPGDPAKYFVGQVLFNSADRKFFEVVEKNDSGVVRVRERKDIGLPW